MALSGLAVLVVAGFAMAAPESRDEAATTPSIASEPATTPDATPAVPSDKNPPIDPNAQALALTGIQVSGNTVEPFLASSFPDSFGGLYATKPDGSAYTIIVVGDPGPIQAAVAQRFTAPGLVGPLPVVTYQLGSVTLTQMQAAVGAIMDAAPKDGTGIVVAGVDPMRAGLVIQTVGPTDGLAEKLQAIYGVPIASVTHADHAGELAYGSITATP
jgi:hypothetical protein